SDGTSNTMLWSENTTAKVSTSNPLYGLLRGATPAWSPATWLLLFDSQWPPNAVGTQLDPNGHWAALNSTNSASSFHPGGVNVSFCDGSVHFIKNTINAWTVNDNWGGPNPAFYIFTTDPVTGNRSYNLTAAGMPGVWQALSTRNGGEVISADQY